MPSSARGPSHFRTRRQLLSGLGAAGLGALLPSGAAFAQAARFGTADYGLASIDPLYSMAYLAAKKGYADSAGLAVKVMNAQSGPRAKQMLAAGQLFAATSGVNDPVSLTVAGKQAVLVAGFDTRFAFGNVLVSKKLYDSGVRDVKALAGHSIGITQPQSATWLMAVYLADRAGVKDKVQIKPLGDFATMLGAVKSGAVDSCTATYSMLHKARQEGWGVPLFEVTDDRSWNAAFGGDIPGVGLYVMQETIEQRPDAVQALVTGITKATDFIAANSAANIVAAIGDDLQGYTPELSIDSVNAFKKFWSTDNLITREHYQRLLTVMGGRQLTDDEVKLVPYEKMVDMRFVKAARKLA